MSSGPNSIDRNVSSNKRWALVRDVFVFQFKLMADGMRDLLLSPLSIIGSLWGIISRPEDPGYYFRQLMVLGHKSDRFINLFGRRKRSRVNSEGGLPRNLDEFIDGLENLLAEKMEQDDISDSVKSVIDQSLDALHKLGNKQQE